MQTDIASIDQLHVFENLLRKGYKSDLVGKTLNKLTEIELSRFEKIGDRPQFSSHATRLIVFQLEKSGSVPYFSPVKINPAGGG